MNNKKYTFTVFTSTFNRSYLLGTVYNCLKNQTFKDFEWIIIDDGSTDDTKKIVESWQKESIFLIRYYYQKNMGLHAAINHGVKKARGKLFLQMDSDDMCEPIALEKFKYYWDSIPEVKQAQFSAVTVLCKNKEGNIVGDKFPKDIFDSNTIEIHDRFKIKGEKWGFHRTEILKKYPFPVFIGEKRVPSSLIWNRISLKYKTRYVNEALKRYASQEDSISKSITTVRINSPKGTSLFYNEYMSLPTTLLAKIKACINYVRFSLHGKYKFIHIFKISTNKVLTIIFFAIGFCIFLFDEK